MTFRRFLKRTRAGRIIMIPYRLLFIALPVLLHQLGLMLRWSVASKEHYNHSYNVTDLSRDYMISSVALITNLPYPVIAAYFRELESDQPLRSSLRLMAASWPDRHNSDVEPKYGRRLAWYALVRALKPKVVVETGVDRGLGTMILAAALARNTEEGSPGTVYGMDINPTCGHLLAMPHGANAQIQIGNSVELIRGFHEPIDMLIHDSDHRPEYESSEYMAADSKLSKTAIIISDNARISSMLQRFARLTGRQFVYIQDQPSDHWWPGDGIGVAYVSSL